MGFLYDVNAAWNFGQRQFLNARFSPYLVVGAGGLTSEIRDGSAAFVNGAEPQPVQLMSYTTATRSSRLIMVEV